MKDYLVLISIGPVQDFIASARKLRDLWFGSHLLSELSKVVAKSLYDNNCELIFPHVENVLDLSQDSKLIVANKIMAKLSSEENPDQLIQQAKIAWREQLGSVYEEALEDMKRIKKIRINEELFRKQINDSGEFFAAWKELDGEYSDCKDQLEKLLAGRKNLREFQAPGWDGYGIPKSSLDGMREAVIGDNTPEVRGLLKKNERLDALACVKRFYPLKSSPHFDDLSDVALMPYLEKIYKSDKLESLLSSYESFFIDGEGKRSSEAKRHSKTELNIVSDLLYAQEDDLKKILELEEAKQSWKSLKKLTSAVGEPPKYACILLGDGDKMGQALDQIKTAKGHSIFSKYLGDFTKDVEEDIDEFDASLIYAGGDDVMAYVPLHRSIDCADKIRQIFNDSMSKIFDELKLSGEKPTFSIGLAIVHHSYPLDQALNLARKAEKCAKEKGGRNALAIIQSKRGGSDIEIYGKWDHDSNRPGIAKRLKAMTDLYCEEGNTLPSTLGYQLRQASIECGKELAFETVDGKLVPANAASTQVLRIFKQKENSENLRDLLKGRQESKRLSDELVITRQIAENMLLAQGRELTLEDQV